MIEVAIRFRERGKWVRKREQDEGRGGYHAATPRTGTAALRSFDGRADGAVASGCADPEYWPVLITHTAGRAVEPARARLLEGVCSAPGGAAGGGEGYGDRSRSPRGPGRCWPVPCPGSSRACGTSPAQGEALGALDDLDKH